jgi:hypothetical protein
MSRWARVDSSENRSLPPVFLVHMRELQVWLGDFDNDVPAVLLKSDTTVSIVARSTDCLEFHVDFEIGAISTYKCALQTRVKASFCSEDLQEVISRHTCFHCLHPQQSLCHPLHMIQRLGSNRQFSSVKRPGVAGGDRKKQDGKPKSHHSEIIAPS